jgi:hypothetical protein
MNPKQTQYHFDRNGAFMIHLTRLRTQIASANILGITSLLIGTWLVGCAENMASFNHFPNIRESDLLAIDSLQTTNTKTSRWFYNCNFENDYKVSFSPIGFDSIKTASIMALEKERFHQITFSDTDSTITGTRGLTLWEFKTLVKVYIKQTKTRSAIYIKTEISQDITCGPNIDRAAPIINNICKSLQCINVKEIHPDTKQKLNLSINSHKNESR